MTQDPQDPGKYIDDRAAEFAKRLRTIRERKNFTQIDLGTAAGLSPAAISQLESGDRRPNFATLVRLAKALGVTPDTLLGVEGAEAQEPQLRGLFRQLEGMSSGDIAAVRGFISFLEQQGEGEKK